MKLTEKDIRLFKALHESETGTLLLDYLGRLQSELGDLSMITPENLQARRGAAELIKDLMTRIKVSEPDKPNDPNQFV